MTVTGSEPAVATEPAGTTASPSGRQLWRAARLPAAVVVLVLITGGVVALVNGGTERGDLTVGGVSPGGGRALATLLRERGVDVVRARSVAAAETAAGRGSTVFVPVAPLVAPERLAELRGTGADLVLGMADSAALHALGIAGVVAGGEAEVRTRQPACALPAARRAGSARMGGQSYRAAHHAPGTTSCYPAGNGAGLVTVGRVGAGRVTLVGSPELFTNDRLDDAGDAALALNLLGAHPRLVWLEPVLEPATAADGGQRGILTLLPGWVRWGVAALGLAVVVVALARARRFGPVVTEPLPVVVRSAEAVEGRARLYRTARARDRAADALREASRSRLAGLLGRSQDVGSAAGGGSDWSAALVEVVARRTRRGQHGVGMLLFGPAPADDAALVQLAADLDTLETEVRRS